jgi:hypothetical protein
MAVSGSIGGIPAISAVCVIFVGILGAVFGHTLLNLMRIRTKASRGLSMGTASHALGTARCAEAGLSGRRVQLAGAGAVRDHHLVDGAVFIPADPRGGGIIVI